VGGGEAMSDPFRIKYEIYNFDFGSCLILERPKILCWNQLDKEIAVSKEPRRKTRSPTREIANCVICGLEIPRRIIPAGKTFPDGCEISDGYYYKKFGGELCRKCDKLIPLEEKDPSIAELSKKGSVLKSSEDDLPSRLGEGIVVPKAPVGSGSENLRKEEGESQ
jgi:hypothetical protein